MGKDLVKVNKIVFMCSGGTCNKKGSEQNIVTLRACIKENQLDDQVHTIKTLCTGQCESGPMMMVYPEGVWYKELNPERAESIITKHIMEGQELENILYKEGEECMFPVEQVSK